MGRKLREYAPGVPFHITARVALKQQLFEDERVRDSVVTIAEECLARSDAEAVAFCVMPNHLHLIVIHGIAPLRQLMQPMLRRISLRVQKHYCVTGHVFDSRFFAKACMDARYFRSMIVYTHLNPCRAAIVESPSDYRWSSHNLYAGNQFDDKLSSAIKPALDVFAASEADLKSPQSYLDHVAFRLEFDACRSAGVVPQTRMPDTPFGDGIWLERYAERTRALDWHSEKKVDLRDIARRISESNSASGGLDYIRGPGRSREQSLLRSPIVDAASRAGYAGCEIARFLGMTEGRVSQILTANRALHPVRRRFRAQIVAQHELTQLKN